MIYEYHKGIGWAPNNFQRQTFACGNCLITVVQKTPDIGDYFWLGQMDVTVHCVMQSSGWNQIFSASDETIKRSLSIWSVLNTAPIGASYLVITWERV